MVPGRGSVERLEVLLSHDGCLSGGEIGERLEQGFTFRYRWANQMNIDRW